MIFFVLAVTATTFHCVAGMYLHSVATQGSLTRPRAMKMVTRRVLGAYTHVGMFITLLCSFAQRSGEAYQR